MDCHGWWFREWFTTRQNATDMVQGEFERFFRRDQLIESIGNADRFPLVFEDGNFGGGANDSVEAGSIPPRWRYRYSACQTWILPFSRIVQSDGEE
jgi:hypothetical protein